MRGCCACHSSAACSAIFMPRALPAPWQRWCRAACRSTIRNAALAGATATIVDQVRAGGSLSAALRDAGVFPPLLVYMTASGESAGRLEVMLERAADYLEREFDRFTAASMALLEPVIIVLMGSCVALIILAILLPILQLQNLAGI